MKYLNIHTHTPVAGDEQTIPSFGLHPWHLTEAWPEMLQDMAVSLQQALSSPEKTDGTPAPLFIGECGLDRVCTTPYPLQLAAFEAQIQLSEHLRLPLVIHGVRTTDDLLRLKRSTHQPWIFHGFRGKPQQLQQLLSHGFYISFGFLHNPDSLRACPLERLFLETDDTPQPIATLYATAAPVLGTTPEALNNQLWNNLSTLFRA